MPRIKYKCNLCENHIIKMFTNTKDIVGFLFCECGGVMDRQLGLGSSKTTEFVDNGVQARRVEIPKDMVEMMAERSKDSTKKKD